MDPRSICAGDGLPCGNLEDVQAGQVAPTHLPPVHSEISTPTNLTIHFSMMVVSLMASVKVMYGPATGRS